jgi:hypothetical protein
MIDEALFDAEEKMEKAVAVDLLTSDRPGDIAIGKQVENQNRHSVVHT